jgi:hypothetical protein
MVFSCGIFAGNHQKVSGSIVNDNNSLPIPNVNIINLNKVRGAVSNDKGYFEIEASLNDTLHLTFIGFQSLKIRVHQRLAQEPNHQNPNDRESHCA